MTLQRSPTLVLAAAVEAARARGSKAYSLSTPTFPERGTSLEGISTSTLLSPAVGQEGLRKQCRQVLFGKWNLPGHGTMISAGAKAAILATLRAACEPGDRVLIIAPSWPSYADITRLLYLEPRFFETRFEDSFAIDTDALARAVDDCQASAIVLCNPGNPTGRIVPGAELEAVSRIAREREAVLLLDESFSGVIFEPEKWQESRCAGHEYLVVVGSISKSHHLQGLRIGACLARGSMLESIIVVHQTALSSAPSLSQSVASALMTSLDGPDFGVVRELALETMEKRGWLCAPSEGSFYMFPRVAQFDAFEAHAKSRNVYLLRGETFGRLCTDHFRLCFGKTPEEFRQAFEALELPRARFGVAA